MATDDQVQAGIDKLGPLKLKQALEDYAGLDIVKARKSDSAVLIERTKLGEVFLRYVGKNRYRVTGQGGRRLFEGTREATHVYLGSIYDVIWERIRVAVTYGG